VWLPVILIRNCKHKKSNSQKSCWQSLTLVLYLYICWSSDALLGLYDICNVTNSIWMTNITGYPIHLQRRPDVISEIAGRKERREEGSDFSKHW